MVAFLFLAVTSFSSRLLQDNAEKTSLVIGQSFMASNTDPAKGSTGWSLTSHGVAEKLFTADDPEGLVVPQLATKAVQDPNQSNKWTITLAAGRKFSDGSDVTAEDVKACLDRTIAENYAAQTSVGIMTLTVVDATTLTITSPSVTPIMDSVLAEWVYAIYKKTASGAFVFTGPYKIESMTEKEIQLVPNTYHHTNYCERNRITIKKYGSGAAIGAALVGGMINLAFNLPATLVTTLNWVEGLMVRSFQTEYQYMLFFDTLSTKKPALQDVNVRKALSLAINRQALANAVAPAGMPQAEIDASVAVGPFLSTTPWASGMAPLRNNPTESAALLDAAGWTMGDDGFRVKGGVTLSLDLVYYTFRSDLVTFAPLVKAQLGAIGVNVTTVVNDDGSFWQNSGNWDMLMWAQNTLPAGDPSWFLNTFFESGPAVDSDWSAQNFAGINSAGVDSALATLTAAATGLPRKEASDAAVAAIEATYAATFLTSAVWHVGLDYKVKAYVPSGSDYYVVKTAMPQIVSLDVLEGCAPPSPPPPPPAGTDSDETSLYVAIGVLAGATAIALAALVYFVMKMKAGTAAKAAEGPTLSKTPEGKA